MIKKTFMCKNKLKGGDKMRKLIIIILILFLFPHKVYAQNAVNTHVSHDIIISWEGFYD